MAIGPRSFKKDDLHEALMRNLIAAMKKHGVRRIVNLSAWGVNNKQAVMSSFFFEYFFRPVFLRHIWADKSALKRCSWRAGSTTSTCSRADCLTGPAPVACVRRSMEQGSSRG